MEEIEKKGQSAWVDEDDETLQINLNKKNRLKKLKQGEESMISGYNFI